MPAWSQMIAGANLPWHAYGDLGGNSWGFRGFATDGFTAALGAGTGGIRGVRRVDNSSHAAGPGLLFRMALGSPPVPQQSGELTVNLVSHFPAGCPATANVTHFNLEGVELRAQLCIPPGGSGWPNPPVWFQFVLKSETGGEYHTLLSPPVALERAWEGSCADFTFRAASLGPGERTARFDAGRVVMAGIRLTANALAGAPVTGEYLLKNLAILTSPPIAFDFASSTLEKDLRAIGALARLAGAAVSVARVFLFVDGRSGILWGPDSTSPSLDTETVFPDLDALTDAATRAGVQILPVLFDYQWANQARVVSGVQLGGRARSIRDPARRRALLDGVVRPVLQRYGAHPSILAWQVINEPEWVTRGVPGYTPNPATRDAVELAEMRAFIRETGDAVRALTRQPASVGSARRIWLPLWRDLGLNLYAFHSYDSDSAEPFPWRRVEELHLDGPVLVGEVPTANTARRPGDYLAAARAGGYAGLLYWSCRARDSATSFAGAMADLNSRLPLADANGLLNAASYASGRPLAPEAWFTLFGANLAAETVLASQSALPETLGGVAVELTDSAGVARAARLLFVSPGQVNFLTPRNLSPGPMRVTLSRIDGGTAEIATTAAAVSPGLFAANVNGQGPAAALIARVRNGWVTATEPVFRCGATPGSCTLVPVEFREPDEVLILMLFGTGIRHQTAGALTVRIADQTLAPAYAGAQNEFAGLDQVNVELPRTLGARGRVEVSVEAGGQRSNTVTLEFR